ncbi:hypothetical protein N7481_011644 [Penicillium waksmanii]|uniref:uncharacterized protein n=1 Tax=Penicillium waksmanii TaxID=69791 RepID=UPI002548921F|nr:uncharacterized protein N7481_011644 [Penicillium waksmanii]KAJ5974434.1 hypothetical protein N7481_011644 [Penicillium waksmanii]
MKFIFTLVSFLVLLAMMAEGRSLYQGSPPGDNSVVHDEQSLNDLAKDSSGTILYSSNGARATVTEELTRYHTAPPSDAIIFHDEQSLSDLIKDNPDTLLYSENGGYYLKNMEEAVIGIAADDLCEYLGASFAFFNDAAGANAVEEPECLHEKDTGKCPAPVPQCPADMRPCALEIVSTEVVLHALTRSFVLSKA